MKKASHKITGKTPDAPIPKLPPSEGEIRARAYHIYLTRGGADGMALNDWLAAEEELKRKLGE